MRYTGNMNAFVMMSVYLFLFGLLIGAFAVYTLMRRKRSVSGIAVHVEKQHNEKQIRKERIVKFLKEKGTVVNDDIEALLGVSDITATRYLQELESEGRVEQVGSSGRYVSYRLKGVSS